MINNVVLVGYMSRDPELKHTQSGKAFTYFTVACNRPKTQDGQQQADFINCVAWNKNAENLCQYLGKGSKVGVEGRIQTRSYENQQGQKVYVTEVLANRITFLDSREASQRQMPQPANTNAAPYQGFDISDDEIPF
ncbi:MULTISPECIES: single-stranded DNA-binding protein [Aerococcus]|uniref:Single-stranded DNA-binding protein n=1 Tax=Aerococcus tenax TaxID=3078812 RepID=A0A329PMC0_9LACT|nr:MULTISPECIES: single-stranded DNA-binding protein [Aerococcus]MDL5184751.1 single-stranded DNA-binding protein [Aerococcus mictus]KAA9238593.1 single-stranded DNA-binding protein [Aerococcus urinae]MDK6371976.1 single-stranded DNA-binding protein [Aerococcus urinae]MDK7302416.1 single-stranded DNA-binding protein [Aerococcus urinae]MDK7802275.1 single-stranded DNA-binding protein [Aerococcus urinae]